MTIVDRIDRRTVRSAVEPAARAPSVHNSQPWVLTHRAPLLDSGSLWFALVLLIYSALFALWRWLTGPPVPPRGRPLGGRHVVTAVAAITACSFAVRLWFTARSGQIGDLHLWQWPACAGMFVFGVSPPATGGTGTSPTRSTAGAGRRRWRR